MRALEGQHVAVSMNGGASGFAGRMTAKFIAQGRQAGGNSPGTDRLAHRSVGQFKHLSRPLPPKNWVLKQDRAGDKWSGTPCSVLLGIDSDNKRHIHSEILKRMGAQD